MSAQLITTDDLYVFKLELLSEIQSLIVNNGNFQNQKKWLKSNEVRKFLKISPGTLQNLRINGTLSFTKIGSIFYYDYNEIEKLLANNKIDFSSPPDKLK
jgi:hypothetical protein